MEREKTDLECEFDGLKDNRLCYKCRECGEIWYDSINGLIKKFPSTYQFCNGDLNKFILLPREGIPMNTWIAGKNLAKPHYHLKKFFIVIWI